MADEARVGDKDTTSTLLTLPVELKRRIVAQGEIDRRPFKLELLALVEESLERREKKR